LQCIGRADTQVKVRGQRLETSEVERALKSHPYVKASSVVVVKDQERELLVGYVMLNDVSTDPNDLVNMWSEQYNDEEFCEDLVGPDQHDSARWRSMLDGSVIPPEQMDEWLDNAIQQIDARPGDRVLEIGVGTGQIALKLVNHVAHFTGVDMSRPSLDYLQSQVDQRGCGDKMALHLAPAHEISRRLSNGNISLVIINSVAQYFPSGEYLTDVIKQAMQMMKSGGRIFLGDIRSYGLIEYHNTQRTLGSLPSHASVIDVRKALESFSITQTELLLNPSFFFRLQHSLQGIAHVEILPKVMSWRNELSRYRYTVVLHVALQPILMKPSNWLDFSTVDTPVQGLRSVLCDSEESTIGLTNIRVLDLEDIYTLRTQIDGSDAEDNVSSLRGKLALQSGELFSPHALRLAAAQEGWTAFFDFSLQGFGTDCHYLRAIFARTSSLPTTERNIAGAFDDPAILPGPTCNTIVGPTNDFVQVKEIIIAHVRETLPDYMVPHIVTLDAFPLTVSGKMDSRLLASAQFFDAHDIAVKSSEGIIESP
jgi:ubiquinone/menaquinone biosynthesis C-methylase UbiE